MEIPTVELLQISINAAVEAGIEILKIYNEPFDVTIKDNNSPLTQADLAANAIINRFLQTTNIPIISEENKQLDFSIRKNWDTCWLVDPLDGTKEFINKNGEFTVNIALIQKNRPVLGVVFVPFTRELYYADVKLKKAAKITLDNNFSIPGLLFPPEALIYRNGRSATLIRIVASRSHMSQETEAFIENIRKDYAEVVMVSKGSSLKFCLVTEGKADIYPRFGPTMEWDTAAGQAICEAVGVKVIDCVTSVSMMYNKETLLNNYFIVE